MQHKLQPKLPNLNEDWNVTLEYTSDKKAFIRFENRFDNYMISIKQYEFISLILLMLKELPLIRTYDEHDSVTQFDIDVSQALRCIQENFALEKIMEENNETT